ncbi:Vacuolar amino acid transporter 5 [Schizosaccharomyces pombe 972h-] [Rhizoctonia solani]|uniref:Vacuolar amino acid transporter 5 [Schizosaccharomyces pombe 972h-] n=1 Tax=Rhizoctonia solani TaxID=456999 RepID=A0A0K6FS42_9AGAM|nr:Vacuolar amino acid transporter 5 [Schizosaccharomyces pombe 972h-] [Rhizoctonia solani]
MARTYGIAPVDRDDTVAESDNAPLLGAGPPKVVEEEDGHATITSCVGNLANTIIGSGMLTFPLVMASGGILLGALTCLSSATIGALGLWMLSRCATRTPHRKSSFFAVSKITFPSAAVFFDAAIAIKCFGVSISYLIIIKGLMPAVVRSFYHVFTAPDVNPPWWAVSGHVWIVVFLAFLAPLCFLDRLDSLRHTSYVALFSVFYLVGIVIFCYWFPPEGIIKPGEIHLIHFDKSFISTFPVQVFAFTCAQNLFPLYNELKSNTQARMNIVIFTSIFSATATYEVIALFGYLTFGSKVGPNIIAMYPSTTLFIAIGQFAIVIMVMFSYPLQVHPCRGCLDKVIGGAKKTIVPPSETQSLNEEEEVEAEALDPHGSHGKMSTTKHVALTSAIVGFGFMIAYFVDDLQLILSFVGSTGSTTISFILPGLFYFKLFRNEPGHSRVLLGAALGLAAYGALIFVFCLTFNIIKVIDAHRV